MLREDSVIRTSVTRRRARDRRPGKLRVLHVLNLLRESGAEKRLVAAASRWRKLGIEGGVLSTAAWEGPYADTMREAGFTVHRIHLDTSRLLARSPALVAKGLVYLWKLRQLVVKERYDVVHIHAERAAFYTALSAITGGAGVVRSISTVFPFEGRARAWRAWQRRVLRRLGVRMVAVSPSVADNEWRRFGNPALIVSNWIDPDHFRPPTTSERRAARSALGIDSHTRAICTVGNCAPVKNHPSVIAALAKLPRDDWTYLHVGEEEAGRPELELAIQLGIADRCRFLGRRDDVARILHASDLYVMASQYEGFSVAALEALASGIPSVLTDVPGLRDLKGVPGTSWSSPDPASLADSIATVLETRPDEGTRAAARRAASVVAGRFGVERAARMYSAVYRDVARSG